MATIAETIESYKLYFKESAKDSMSWITENTGAIKEYVKNNTAWAVQKAAEYKAYFIENAQYAIDTGIYYAKASLGAAKHFFINLKDNFYWAMDCAWYYLVKGFWMGYNLATSIANTLVDVIRAIPSAIEKTLQALQKLADLCWQFVSNVAHFAWDLTCQIQTLLKNTANFAWDLVRNIPTMLKNIADVTWQFVTNVARMAWDILCEIPTLLKNIADASWQVLKEVGSLTYRALRHCAQHLHTLAQFAGKKAMTGLGIVFGLCSAVVDLSCDFIGFVFGKRVDNIVNAESAKLPKNLFAAALGIVVIYQAAKLVIKGAKKLYNEKDKIYATVGQSINAAVVTADSWLFSDNTSPSMLHAYPHAANQSASEAGSSARQRRTRSRQRHAA